MAYELPELLVRLDVDELDDATVTIIRLGPNPCHCVGHAADDVLARGVFNDDESPPVHGGGLRWRNPGPGRRDVPYAHRPIDRSTRDAHTIWREARARDLFLMAEHSADLVIRTALIQSQFVRLRRHSARCG